MAPSNKSIIGSSVLMLLCISFINAIDTDIACLKAFIDSVEDPKHALSSWNFTTTSPRFICTFVGIECWNSFENKVIIINLRDFGLKGVLPVELANCTSIMGLDLSGNLLFGNLPTNISEMLPFVTSLDLSSNNFSGQIPQDLANCPFLNVLKLDNNGFSGQVPVEFGRLTRIREFNVANNSLYGQVPVFQNANITADSYAGNPGLCGGPLPRCP